MIDHRICFLEKKPEKTAAELVPPQYHVYLDVFKKKASERMPPANHGIMLLILFQTLSQSSPIYILVPQWSKQK